MQRKKREGGLMVVSQTRWCCTVRRGPVLGIEKGAVFQAFRDDQIGLIPRFDLTVTLT